MKKLISAALAVLLLLSLCACKSNTKDMLSDINNIISRSTVIKGAGKLFDKNVSGSEIKKINKAEVAADGITTLCYETLTDKQKDIYKYIFTAANEMPDGWFSCGKKCESYEKNISVAYKAVLNDNPQFFWMPSDYVVALGGSNLCMAFKLNEDGIANDYLMSKEERDAKLPVLNQKAEELLNTVRMYQSDFDKELFVHDYLCNNAVYNLNAGPMIYTSYGALVDGVCVCEGYSRAMQLIMQKSGIKCGLVYGVYDNSGHMWNYINISGEWYHLDITWDKSADYGATHMYFNLSDEEALKSHTVLDMFDMEKTVLNGENYNMLNYACTSAKDNYYERLGLVLTDDVYKNAQTVLNSHRAGDTFGEYRSRITADENEILNSVAQQLYPALPLSGYTKSEDMILIFFQNTY